ncbi:hypothetical protein JA1_001482 [Spathaspora sp. JA1]|nr:hypothetical protein JA1_001482 [Spathaspora sp. JA1]
MTTSPSFFDSFKTKSGKPITIGTGTGTKWKRSLNNEEINQELVEQIKSTIKLGFNHIDTAQVYNTHEEVGVALKQLDVSREDLWITTKYCPGLTNQPPSEIIDLALKQFNTEYIDLFLIHHPFFQPDNVVSLEQAWIELIQAKKQGKVREIGVSNFSSKYLQEITKISEKYGREYFPSVNQIEFHPFLQNQSQGIVKYCHENNILIEAYSPLAPLSRVGNNNPLIKYLIPLEEKYNKTSSQLLLRYCLQNDILPITTSSKAERMKQSLDIFDFELSNIEIEQINKIGQENPYRDPVTIGIGTGTVVKHLKSSQAHNATSDEIVKLLTYAISIGYNHIDTAAVYNTQPEVGKAFFESGIDRDKIFLSTKFSVFNDDEEKTTITATQFVESTLKELRTDYIDLLMIHHPFFEPDHSEKKYTLQSLWLEFINIKKSGKVRFIGVSNFSISHLSSIINISKPFGREYFPVVNQIEFHACLQNQSPDIVSFCQINNILVQGYSPLTPLFRLQEGNVYLHRLLMDLESKYKKTKGQILLRYCLDKGVVPITTSCQESRLKEGIDIYDFKLEEDEIAKIDKEGAKSIHQVYFAGKY